MTVSDISITIDNETEEITVDFMIDDTVVSHPLDNSEVYYKRLERAALEQYREYRRKQLEELNG